MTVAELKRIIERIEAEGSNLEDIIVMLHNQNIQLRTVGALKDTWAVQSDHCEAPFTRLTFKA